MTRKYYTYRIRITSFDRVQAEIRDADNNLLGEPSGKFVYDEIVRTRIQAFHQKAGQGMLMDAEVEQFGEVLFATLFDEGLRHDFFTRYQTARAEKALLRIELDVDEDQLLEVAALPWEFLRVPAETGYGTVWFGTAPDLIFSRRRALWTAAAPIHLKDQEPLRIALAVAAPENLGPVEYKELLASLKALTQTTRIELLEPVIPANRSSIDDILRQKPHIFHFIGHAKFSDDQQQQEGQIALAHTDRTMELVSADDFSELFTRHQPGVVVLQSCEGGKLSASKAFVGIASQIVQQNIPVVVAMQYQVSNITATRFVLEFYKRLAENDPVDLAVQEGRRQIALGPAGYNRRDFATPNLFMRVRDGHLFLRQLNVSGRENGVHMKQDKENEGKYPQQEHEEEKIQEQGISISVGGNATFEGVSFGNGGKVINKVEHAENIVQADHSTVTITKTTSTQQGMSVEEVLKLFEQLYKTVNDMEGVPRKAKIDVKAEVEKAIAEIEDPEGGEPDKETVAEHLKTATETLKAAGATALQAVTFGKLVGQAVGWLGTNYEWLLQML